MANSTTLARIRFFETSVHHPKVKETLAGNNEIPVMKILSAIDLEDKRDYQRQYPIGERFVIDFAFPNEQIALEVDGKDHEYKEKKAMDRKRDMYLRKNNWLPIRIKDKGIKDLYGQSFYKSLIKDIVMERRAQYTQGVLYPIDIPYYNDEDYE